MDETLEFEIVTDPTEAPTEAAQVTETATPVVVETLEAPEVTETIETAETVAVVDYRATITESTSILTNIILCAALMIVGVLVAFKFWEAK